MITEESGFYGNGLQSLLPILFYRLYPEKIQWGVHGDAPIKIVQSFREKSTLQGYTLQSIISGKGYHATSYVVCKNKLYHYNNSQTPTVQETQRIYLEDEMIYFYVKSTPDHIETIESSIDTTIYPKHISLEYPLPVPLEMTLLQDLHYQTEVIDTFTSKNVDAKFDTNGSLTNAILHDFKSNKLKIEENLDTKYNELLFGTNNYNSSSESEDLDTLLQTMNSKIKELEKKIKKKKKNEIMLRYYI
jgi:hypothetical protein